MTDRPPSPDAQFAAFLSRFPPEIVALVKRCLPKLRRALPGATRLVYDYRDSLVVSFSPSDRGYEGVVSIAVDARRVRLYLPKDTPDPAGRLEGSGSKVRSVVVEAASDLDRGELHALILAAIRHSGVTFPRARSSRVLIRSETRKKAPRRASPTARAATTTTSSRKRPAGG